MPRRLLLPAVIAALLLIPSRAPVQAMPQLLAAHPLTSTAIAIPGGWPKLLSISTLGIRAPVEPDPLTRSKPIDQQPRWSDVLWYSRGTKPGDPGRAVLFGHLDSFTAPAVFWHLHALAPGDRFTVAYAHAPALTFQVAWSHVYPDAAVPYPWMFGQAGWQRSVILVTCSGIFHGLAQGGYDHRLLVYARLVLPSGRLA